MEIDRASHKNLTCRPVKNLPLISQHPDPLPIIASSDPILATTRHM